MPRDGVYGLDEVLGNLNKELAGIKNRSIAGLLEGGLVVQRDAQRNVPVEYGNLRASAYTRKAQDDPQAVEVGFTAAYAVFVHEDLEQTLKGKPRPSGLGTYWNPGGPKFLERSLRDNERAILEIVRARASVGESA